MRNINSMLITNWEGLILEANRETANLFGYDQKILQTMEIGRLHKLDHEKLGDGFSNLSLGETISYETIIQTQNNNEISVEVRVHAIQADEFILSPMVFPQHPRTKGTRSTARRSAILDLSRFTISTIKCDF